MADELKIIQTGEHCRHLLSKGLYINQGLLPGEEATGDGNFWCGQNQTTYGPDDKLCDGENCCDASRSCYEAP